MTILAHSLYDKYTYFLGVFNITNTNIIKQGLFCKVDASGAIVLADKGGYGMIAQWPKDSDIIKKGYAVAKASLFYGDYVITVDEDSFDATKTYQPMQQLIVGDGGKLTNDLSVASNPVLLGRVLKIRTSGSKTLLTVACVKGKHTATSTANPVHPVAATGLTVTSAAGATVGYTHLTVNPSPASGNSLRVKETNFADYSINVGDTVDGTFHVWNGTSDVLPLGTPRYMYIVEVDASDKAVKAGSATLVVKTAPAPVQASGLTVTSAAGTATGDTLITVAPAKAAGNTYKYKSGATAPAVPNVGDATATGYTTWDGTADITLATGQYILVVEVDASGNVVKAGSATVTAKA